MKLRKIIATIAVAALVSGCAVEATILAGAVVTAPVWAPITYAVQQNLVVQPIEVMTASGKQLTPSYGDATKAKFKVTNATIKCTGQHDLSKKPGGLILLKCDKALKGQMTYSMFMTRKLDLSIGMKAAPENEQGKLSQVKFKCNGLYNAPGGRVDPFLIDCGNNGKAAIASVKTVSGSPQFKVWIYPPR